jgi:hypothetical protein
MQKLAFVLLISIFTVGLTAHLVAAPSGRPIIAVMEFHPAHLEKWVEDNEVDLGEGDHFIYRDDHSIDLGMIREDKDLAMELNSKGKDELIQQIVHGQNVVNTIFSVGETKVIDSTLEKNPNVSVLTLHSKQELPDGNFERIEKFYIGSGQTLHAELRWKIGVDSKALKQARADFADGKFSLAGVKEASK